MNCLRCSKELGEVRKGRKFCDNKCRAQYNSKLQYYNKNRDDEEYRAQQKIRFKKWYENNKERQYQHISNDWKKNKAKWNVRKAVMRHRARLLELLPKTCYACGEPVIKELHHLSYDIETGGSIKRKDVEMRIREHAKKLLGFCSRDCHRNYEKEMVIIK